MCIFKKRKNNVNEIAKDVYDDGLKSTIKESGKILSLIPRAIHAVLVPLEKWILNREYTLKETEKILESKLDGIDPSQIEEPEAYVAVPAINAISYSYQSDVLLNMYANLLASSMLKDRKWKVHPSYVEIIKQLLPDEAKLLMHIANNTGENEYPLISLAMEKTISNRREHYYVLKNYSNIGDSICDLPNNISSYIDNLSRLNLIEIIEDEIVSNFEYSIIDNSNFIKQTMQITDLKKGFTWIIKHYLFMVTNFGKDFISICVKDLNKPLEDLKK